LIDNCWTTSKKAFPKGGSLIRRKDKFFYSFFQIFLVKSEIIPHAPGTCPHDYFIGSHDSAIKINSHFFCLIENLTHWAIFLTLRNKN